MMQQMKKLAEALQMMVQKEIRYLNTMQPCIIKTVHMKKGTKVPYMVDIQLKTEPKGTIIPKATLVHYRAGKSVIISPVKIGDIGLAFFAQQGADNLMDDRKPRDPIGERSFNRIDCFVIVGGFVENEDYPEEYKEGDLYIKAPASPGRIVLGGYSGLKKVLVDGDSNIAGGVSASQSKVYVGEP